MGPCLGLGKVRGGGEGPGQVRAGGPLEALRKCLLGVGRNCPGDRGALLLPGPTKVADFTAKLGGKPCWTGRKREGPGGPACMGTRDEQICLWVALGHDVWTLPCQCLMFVAYGYFRTK